MHTLANSAFCAAVSLALFSSPTEAATTPGNVPAVFGTAVIAAHATPYDGRWSKVQSQGLAAGARIAFKARNLHGVERLRFVNRAVNAAIEYRTDTSDSWASASESFSRGAGDCEDYAIAKMQVLRAAGVTASDLFLVIGRDLAARADHAMLIVRAENTYWVLDNFYNEVRADSAYRDFRPVITLSNRGSWLHGYKAGTQVMGAPAGSFRESTSGSFAAIIAAQNGR
ncbi:MAG TPA: transglutaminase-like cysteine peptidase [Sphingomicrobium sp.]|jgi:predicted transglutaminase-like cysteine proteinase|nr:transglutaminase-like cysteine peptidase [Sphingomicrobium sp.]